MGNKPCTNTQFLNTFPDPISRWFQSKYVGTAKRCKEKYHCGTQFTSQKRIEKRTESTTCTGIWTTCCNFGCKLNWTSASHFLRHHFGHWKGIRPSIHRILTSKQGPEISSLRKSNAYITLIIIIFSISANNWERSNSHQVAILGYAPVCYIHIYIQCMYIIYIDIPRFITFIPSSKLQDVQFRWPQSNIFLVQVVTKRRILHRQIHQYIYNYNYMILMYML